jgi:ParB family transcriptional regulator, chromosome partitioning protein
MAEEAFRPRLGRGLAALIGDVGDDDQNYERPQKTGQKRVPIEFLRPNFRNPRKDFAEESLDDLVASVKAKGIVQPIVVRAVAREANAFEIIAGERRWRAAQRAGLHDVPVVVVDVDDKEALELAIIENVQRADLNAIEEAGGYQSLISTYGYTQNDLAKVIGKSRSHIANTLRLLNLPQEIRDAVLAGKLTAGHARALLTMDNPVAAARKIIEQGLSVREVEALGQEQAGKPRKAVSGGSRASDKDADTLALERSIGDALGLAVSIDHKAPGGTIAIRYQSVEQLEDICRRLKR